MIFEYAREGEEWQEWEDLLESAHITDMLEIYFEQPGHEGTTITINGVFYRVKSAETFLVRTYLPQGTTKTRRVEYGQDVLVDAAADLLNKINTFGYVKFGYDGIMWEVRRG